MAHKAADYVWFYFLVGGLLALFGWVASLYANYGASDQMVPAMLGFAAFTLFLLSALYATGVLKSKF